MPRTAPGGPRAAALLALLVAAAPAVPARGAEAPPAAEAEPEPAPPPVVRRLGEVTVTTTRAERDVLEVPGHVSVLTREEIERSGARDVPDLLRREAGIFVTNDTTSPEGYRVEARGFNNGGGNGSGMLVLVDGRRVNEPNSSIADWSFIRLDAIERIEVVRGPASAVWGDNAMAGVIHITTRRGHGPPRFELRGRTGSYDSDGGSLFAGGSAGPLSASLFLEGDTSDGYRERSDFRIHDGEARAELALGERATLALGGGYASSVRQRPGSLDAAQLAEDRRQAEPSTDANFDNARRRFADGTLEVLLRENAVLTLRSWYHSRSDLASLANPFFRFSEDQQASAAGLDSHLELEGELLGLAHRLLLGADVLRETVDRDSDFELFPDPPLPSSSTSRRYLYGFFVQDELRLGERWIVSGGVRYDRARRRARDRLSGNRFGVRHTAWSPKAAVTYRLRPFLSLYASYAQGFRLPNLDEAFGFFGFSPELDPQKSKTWEVGAKLRRERARANLALYTMDVKDEIFFDPLVVENVNLGRVRHRGLEASASLWPLKWLELYGSYTFDDVKITFDPRTGLEGRRMPLTPRHRGTAGVRALLPYGFELGVNGNYVGSRFAVNDVENTSKRPKYARYDAYVGYRHGLGRFVTLALRASVRNLFDRQYSEVAGLRLFAVPPELGFFPSPERHYELAAVLEVSR